MAKSISTKKILTIGGGSGQFALLAGLRDLDGLEITSVVSMVDSGGSTGRLRDEMGILPPGDVLKCILALSPYRDAARNILLKRFVSDRRLRGHNAGNILLTLILYIVNIMTKFGETHNYKGADFVKALEDYIGRQLDGIIINTGQPEDDILRNYKEQKAALVVFDDTDDIWRNRNTYPSDLLDATGDIVRHDSKKLAMLITEIISK